MDDNSSVKYYPYNEQADYTEVDDRNYGDDGGKKGGDKSIKNMVRILVVVVAILAVLLGMYFAMKKNSDKNKNIAGTQTDAVTEEKTTTEEERYLPGEYVVSAEGSLRLRKDHSTDSEHLMTVPTGTVLQIDEIYIDKKATDPNEKFWGKTEHKGWTAWVLMSYLKENDTVSPGIVAESTSSEGESTTSDVSSEVTSSFAGATTTKTSTANGSYAPGKYVVTADEFLRLREEHSVDSETYISIDRDEEITILEIYCDDDAEDSTLKYWGKVSYDGYVGWVAMHYTSAVN